MKSATSLFACAIMVSHAVCSHAQLFNLPNAPIKKVRTNWESTQEYVFTDSKNIKWTAPVGTRTDGASIPQACMSFIGDRMDERYLGAALVHDAYCAEANTGKSPFHTRPWQSVHRMFYEACLAGGTPLVTAKTMYMAVWLYGPSKWAILKESDFDAALLAARLRAERQKAELRLREQQAARESSRQLNQVAQNKRNAESNRISVSTQRQLAEIDAVYQRHEAALKASMLAAAAKEAQELTLTPEVSAEVKLKQFEELRRFIAIKNPSLAALDSVMVRAVPLLKKNEVLNLQIGSKP